MYITTEDYYKGYEEIPNINESDSKARVEFERIVDRHARLYVLNAIGKANFDTLNGFLVNGLLPAVPESPTLDPVPVKWRKLVTGCDYTKDGITLNWGGLLVDMGTYKGSVIADYCYCQWLLEKITYIGGVGEVQAIPKGARITEIDPRYSKVWNEFVRRNQSRLDGSYPLYYGYYAYDFNSLCYDGVNNEVSLLQFLSDNETDYPDCTLKHYGFKNRHGL